MFCFSDVKPSFCFANVKFIAVPATSFVDNLRQSTVRKKMATGTFTHNS